MLGLEKLITILYFCTDGGKRRKLNNNTEGYGKRVIKSMYVWHSLAMSSKTN